MSEKIIINFIKCIYVCTAQFFPDNSGHTQKFGTNPQELVKKANF